MKIVRITGAKTGSVACICQKQVILNYEN